MNTLLQAQGLGYRYPASERAAIEDLSLHMDRGEKVALVGPNGAGKSTLALMLNGTLRQKGSVEIGGIKLTAKTLPEIRRQVGLLFQNPDDQLFMPSLREDLAFGPENMGMSAKSIETEVAHYLKIFKLQETASRAPHQISGGQKRLAALATVLIMQPDLLVLDEPSSGLDPRARLELLRILQELPTALLLATHDLDFALQLCSRCLILEKGHIVSDGPSPKLLSDEKLLQKHGLELPISLSRAKY